MIIAALTYLLGVTATLYVGVRLVPPDPPGEVPDGLIFVVTVALLWPVFGLPALAIALAVRARARRLETEQRDRELVSYVDHELAALDAPRVKP